MKAAGSRLIVLPPILLLAAVLLLVGSCTDNVQWRTDLPACRGGDCSRSALDIQGGAAPFALGVVEFDDQGRAWDPGQTAALFDYMADTVRRTPLAIVTFVHGWQHNARDDDGNVTQFRQLLAAIAAFEAQLPAERRRAVVGVYAGWRGRTLALPYLDALSFWNRKDAAHRVADGSLRGLLGELRAFRDLADLRAGPDPRRETRMVTIGHSFGGLIVYSALAQYYTDRAAASLIRARYFGGADATDHPREKTDPREISSYGDLVVLVNPAYEAIRYEPIRQLVDTDPLPERFAPRQGPVLVQITSVGDGAFDGDTATGIAFPIGRMVNTMTEATRTDPRTGEDERQQIQRAVGHYRPYWTHDLDLPGGAEAHPAAAAAHVYDPATACRAFAEFERSERQAGDRLRPGWRRTLPSGAVLREIGGGRYDPTNPFWVVRAHPSIILDHNDILGPVFVDFVAQLYGDVDRLKHPTLCTPSP